MSIPPLRADHDVERRIVTVLFADIVGFTTLSEELDAEDVATVQDAYFATVRDTIGRYGGQLEKFIGDAAMAVFGLPRTRDDDAERAMRAGLALVSAVELLGARLGLGEGQLKLRVGINSGEVVHAAAGPDDGRVTGDTVNSAARLQTAAAPGTVVVGEMTALAASDAVEFEPMGGLQLKGKAEPVPAWRAVSIYPVVARDHAMGRLRAPTLGRDADLAALTDWLSSVERAGAGRMLIVAPPGVGKTRLVGEFERRLTDAATRPGAVVWRVRLRPEVVAPYEAIAQLLLAGTDSAARPDAESRLRESLEAAGAPPGRAEVVTRHALELAWPLAADGQRAAVSSTAEQRDLLFGAWLEALDALAAPRIAVWIIEDAHWAGPDLLAFFDMAADTVGSTRRGVLVTARPSLLESAPEWCSPEPPVRSVLELTPLAAGDADQLVRTLVGDALPTELVQGIVERSDGNPLFVEELLRSWVSIGTLMARDGGWRLATPVEQVRLPGTVQAIYAGQLDDLSDAARQVARRGSVAGRRLPERALEALDLRHGAEGLETLRRRALLGGPYIDPLSGPSYVYRHALLRDAAYASLARAERARLHVRLARWLEELAGARVTEVAEPIANHYASAIDSAPALATSLDVNVTRDDARRAAAHWFELAGERAASLAAHEAAVHLFRRSIDLTDEDALLHRARRQLRLGEITAQAADMDEGARILQHARELYRSVRGDETASDADRTTARDGLSLAVAALADVWYAQVQFMRAAELAGETLAEIGDRDDVATARLLVARGRCAGAGSGRFDAARHDVERGLALARATRDAPLELVALEALANVLDDSGETDDTVWKQVAEVAERQHAWDKVANSLRVGAIFVLDDHPDAALGHLDRVEEVARNHGLTEQIVWADYGRAEAGFVSGDWDRAVEVAIRAIDLGERNAYRRATVRTWHVVIPIAAARGKRQLLERAARWYVTLDASAASTGGQPDSPYGRIVRPAMDLTLARAGLWQPYVPAVEPRIAAFVGPHGMPSWLHALEMVFESWLEAGLVDGAAEALAGYDEGAEAMSSLARGVGALLRGKLAVSRRSPPAEVAQHGREALVAFRAANAPWWIAKALGVLASVGDATPGEAAERGTVLRKLGVAEGS